MKWVLITLIVAFHDVTAVRHALPGVDQVFEAIDECLQSMKLDHTRQDPHLHDTATPRVSQWYPGCRKVAIRLTPFQDGSVVN
jgi:hypothetical protein